MQNLRQSWQAFDVACVECIAEFGRDYLPPHSLEQLISRSGIVSQEMNVLACEQHLRGS